MNLSQAEKKSEFAHLLLAWYAQHKRELPFRDCKDAYQIWLSEVILQQTQIKQGLPYFERFVLQFPTVQLLAESDEQDVLKLWQGLGYYTRARNLHVCAQQICTKFYGIFPNRYSELIKLKGVGVYTARAILAFAYDLPFAVVDGNVSRVLSRITAMNESIDSTVGKKHLQALADFFLSDAPPSDYNNAIMDLGASICTASAPNCTRCPIASLCQAYHTQSAERYPIKAKRKAKIKRYFYYLLPADCQTVYLKKRRKKDIWKHLFEPPLLETKKPLDNLMLAAKLKICPDDIDLIQECNQLLTHQDIHICFYRLKIDGVHVIFSDSIKHSINEIEPYPLPKPIERFFKTTSEFC